MIGAEPPPCGREFAEVWSAGWRTSRFCGAGPRCSSARPLATPASMLVLSALGFSVLSTLLMLACTILVLRNIRRPAGPTGRNRQRAKADESLRQARHAVDAFIDLEEQELANRPSLYQVRRQFLQTAYAYYQDFLDQPTATHRCAPNLAATAERVGRIVEELSVLSGFGPLTMLTDARVQQDLELSESKVVKVEQILRQLPEEWRQVQASGEQLSQEARQRRLAEFLRSKERSIVEVLTPTQIAAAPGRLATTGAHRIQVSRSRRAVGPFAVAARRNQPADRSSTDPRSLPARQMDTAVLAATGRNVTVPPTVIANTMPGRLTYSVASPAGLARMAVGLTAIRRPTRDSGPERFGASPRCCRQSSKPGGRP